MSLASHNGIIEAVPVLGRTSAADEGTAIPLKSLRY
jgi:hypothetical protein